MRICTYPDCQKKHYSKSLCKSHYRNQPSQVEKSKEYRKRRYHEGGGYQGELVKDPELTKKRTEIAKKYRKTEAYKTSRKDYYSRPETKEKKRQWGKVYGKTYCTPEVKARKQKNRRASNKSLHNKAKRNAYAAELRRTNPNYKLRTVLRTRLRNALNGNPKVGSFVQDLGCSIDFLRQYLESKFKPSMSWENHGSTESSWNIDHIRPLSSFDLTSLEEFKKACHYTNLQPLWRPENLAKGDKMPTYFSGHLDLK